MRIKLFVKVVGLCILLSAFISLVGASTTKAATEEEIENSIVAGLQWLASVQNPDGSWGSSSCDYVAYTGLVVLKFETRARELDPPMDPLDPAYEYSAQVSSGLAYITANAHNQAIGLQPAGDPDGDGDGIGTWFGQAGCPGYSVYNTGIAMMAIAASGHPELYGDILQDAVDWMAWAQADSYCGLHRGGWRYVPDCDSDNSNSGYVTMGLGFAEAPQFGFNISAPQWVKDELSIWIDVIQDDVNGDPDDGGSWYDPSWSWVNILKTGNLIYEMALVGDTDATPRVQDAMDYIERHWYDMNQDPGWRNHRQAMFTMMKGFESLNIRLIDLDNDAIPEYDWFDEVSTHLVSTQNADGSWPWDPWGPPIISTAWALLTLERAVPEIIRSVAFDIKPGSCPNPLNVKSKGVLPAAIMGTQNVDVSTIDPDTLRLRLKGTEEPLVAPLRWAYADVGEPYVPFIGKEDCFANCLNCSCPDGFMDLVFHFDTQEVVMTLLEGFNDRDCLVLEIIGNLKEEFGGTPIVGEDVLLILKKGK